MIDSRGYRVTKCARIGIPYLGAVWSGCRSWIHCFWALSASVRNRKTLDCGRNWGRDGGVRRSVARASQMGLVRGGRLIGSPPRISVALTSYLTELRQVYQTCCRVVNHGTVAVLIRGAASATLGVRRTGAARSNVDFGATDHWRLLTGRTIATDAYIDGKQCGCRGVRGCAATPCQTRRVRQFEPFDRHA